MGVKRFLFFVFALACITAHANSYTDGAKVPEFLRFEGEKTVVADSVFLDKMIGEMDKKYPQIKMKFLLCVLSDEDLSVYSDYRVVSNEYFIDYDSEVEKLYREKLSYGICYYKNRIIFVADKRASTSKKIFRKTSEALKIVLPISNSQKEQTYFYFDFKGNLKESFVTGKKK